MTRLISSFGRAKFKISPCCFSTALRYDRRTDYAVGQLLVRQHDVSCLPNFLVSSEKRLRGRLRHGAGHLWTRNSCGGEPLCGMVAGLAGISLR